MKIKTRSIIVILLLALFSSCQQVDTPQSDLEIAEKLVTVLTVQNAAAEVYADTLEATQDSIAAVNAVGQWLLDQPDVSEAYIWGVDLVEVRFNNGLKSNLVATQHDANGQAVTRGGGSGGAFTSFREATDLIEIPNKKVLVLNAFASTMYSGDWQKKALFAPTIKSEDIDVFNDAEVTLSRLNTIGDYGLVILNTHGVPNGFFIKKRLALEPGVEILEYTPAELLEIVASQLNLPIEKFGNGELQFDTHVVLDSYFFANKWAMVCVTDKWVRNAPFTLNEAVVYGNHCYSGYNQNPARGDLPGAWKSKGAVTYYGYAFNNKSSGAVFNTRATAWEDTLIINLAKGDSTGIAHLANDVTPLFHLVSGNAELPVLVTRGLNFGDELPQSSAPIPLVFTQFHQPNYTYDGICQDSIQDSRDLRWYKTVCIGDQFWFAENLQYSGAGLCYENIGTNCENEGRLYSIQELTGLQVGSPSSPVQGLCPAGWRVPTKTDYVNLVNALGGEEEAKPMLGDPAYWPSEFGFTNESGFSLKPSRNGLYDGYTDNQQEWEDPSTTQNLAGDTRLWTSTREPGALSDTDFRTFIYSADNFNNQINLFYGSSYPGWPGMYRQFPCRCVRDL